MVRQELYAICYGRMVNIQRQQQTMCKFWCSFYKTIVFDFDFFTLFWQPSFHLYCCLQTMFICHHFNGRLKRIQKPLIVFQDMLIENDCVCKMHSIRYLFCSDSQFNGEEKKPRSDEPKDVHTNRHQTSYINQNITS